MTNFNFKIMAHWLNLFTKFNLIGFIFLYCYFVYVYYPHKDTDKILENMHLGSVFTMASTGFFHQKSICLFDIFIFVFPCYLS